MKMAKVAWIGVGNMGSPMSQVLLAAGHEVTVCDVSAEKCAEAVAKGARCAASNVEAIEGAEFVFTILPNPEVLMAVVLGEGGIAPALAPGQIVIDMSTVSIEASAACNEAIEKAGCQFLRCPVNGSTILAAKGELTALCSGPKDAYDKVFPLIEAMSRTQFYLGEGDASRAMKLALNMMVATTSQMMAETIVLCEKAGLARNDILDVMAGSVLASPQVLFKIPPLRENSFEPAFTTVGMAKDVGLALNICQKYGVCAPVTGLTKQLLESLIAQGKGQQDFASLLQLTEEMSGVSDK